MEESRFPKSILNHNLRGKRESERANHGVKKNKNKKKAFCHGHFKLNDL